MLISPEYRKEMESQHEKGKFGGAARHCSIIINQLIEQKGITHLLDYGCGKKQILRQHLKPTDGFRYQAYDPGVPKCSGDPIPAEFVVACDVLEHIEPQCIDDVLDHIESLTEGFFYATISTSEAKKKLSDGRNAHVIQQPMEWWLPKIWERMSLQSYIRHPEGFVVIASKGLSL